MRRFARQARSARAAEEWRRRCRDGGVVSSIHEAPRGSLEKAMNAHNKVRIALYTQQSFVAQGLAAVFRAHADLELAACRDNLSGTLDCLKSTRPDVLLVHRLSGVSLSELHQIRSADSRCQIVLWGQELEGEIRFSGHQPGRTRHPAR